MLACACGCTTTSRALRCASMIRTMPEENIIPPHSHGPFDELNVATHSTGDGEEGGRGWGSPRWKDGLHLIQGPGMESGWRGLALAWLAVTPGVRQNSK
eukprot:scaffold71729_cov27-Tisochrysis_lutea.AAC.1